MKLYVAKFNETEKGLMLEGFRYVRYLDTKTKQPAFNGLYCKYFIKSGNYDSGACLKILKNRNPLVIDYIEESKTFVIKNENQI